MRAVCLRPICMRGRGRSDGQAVELGGEHTMRWQGKGVVVLMPFWKQGGCNIYSRKG